VFVEAAAGHAPQTTLDAGNDGPFVWHVMLDAAIDEGVLNEDDAERWGKAMTRYHYRMLEFVDDDGDEDEDEDEDEGEGEDDDEEADHGLTMLGTIHAIM
jgi:hypothetical protein